MFGSSAQGCVVVVVCSCELGLEGMCRVDSKDRKHIHEGMFLELAVRGGEENTKQPKCALFKGAFFLSGMWGVGEKVAEH